MTAARPRAADPALEINRFTDRRARKMMRTMSRTGESIGRLDIAIAVALSALGLLLMYGTSPTRRSTRAGWRCRSSWRVTIPLLWRRAAPLQAMAAVAVALAVHIALFGSVVRCGVVFPVVGVLVFTRRRALRAHDRAVGARGRPGHHPRHGRRRRDRLRRGLAARAADDRGLRARARRLRPRPHGARAQGPHPGAARGARRARAARGGHRPHAPLGRARRRCWPAAWAS